MRPQETGSGTSTVREWEKRADIVEQVTEHVR